MQRILTPKIMIKSCHPSFLSHPSGDGLKLNCLPQIKGTVEDSRTIQRLHFSAYRQAGETVGNEIQNFKHNEKR